MSGRSSSVLVPEPVIITEAQSIKHFIDMYECRETAKTHTLIICVTIASDSNP